MSTTKNFQKFPKTSKTIFKTSNNVQKHPQKRSKYYLLYLVFVCQEVIELQYSDFHCSTVKYNAIKVSAVHYSAVQ